MGLATPGLSIIVPARNAADTLQRCLEAVYPQCTSDDEVIVVDDCSDDATARIAAGFPVKLIKMPDHRGAAAARNRGGAAAEKTALYFLDADVLLALGALERARDDIADPAVDAIIGSYDESPPSSSTVSRFKNLAHHFFHQRCGREVSSFWGACGLVRRAAFVAAGGFDEQQFVAPSIEDIELGYRMCDAGARITVDPQLRVTHLKQWTLPSLLKTDVSRRAIPWTVLCLERGRIPSELNLATDQRVAALLAVAMLVCAPLALFQPLAAAVVIIAAAAAVWINRELYGFFRAKGGLRLMLAGFALQQFYYLYSLAGLAAGAMIFAMRRSSALLGWNVPARRNMS